MSVKMTKSQVPESRVTHLVNQRLKAFADFKGRNPNGVEREKMKKEIVSLAKKANQDRGL